MSSLIYALIINIFALVHLPWRMLKGRDDLASLKERLYLDRAIRPARIWIHAASLGEIAGTRRLITRLSAKAPVLLTVNTRSARKTARAVSTVRPRGR